MLTALYDMELSTDDDELVDDYSDKDEDEDEESSTEVDPALALEVINALIKALIDKK